MKVIHLISGGDSGGAKTHVHMLLQNLSRTIDVTMVCFMEGPFAQEARELGIHTVVLPGRNLPRTFRTLKKMIREGSYQIIHCHGARGNMMGALLRKATGLPVVTTVHSDYRLDYLGRPFSRLTYGTINTCLLYTSRQLSRLLPGIVGNHHLLRPDGPAGRSDQGAAHVAAADKRNAFHICHPFSSHQSGFRSSSSSSSRNTAATRVSYSAGSLAFRIAFPYFAPSRNRQIR